MLAYVLSPYTTVCRSVLRGSIQGRRPRGSPGVAVGGQRFIERVADVLRVDLGRHPRQRGVDLVLGANAVQQPVGERLTGYAQRRAVLHQSHIVDVGDLRTDRKSTRLNSSH